MGLSPTWDEGARDDEAEDEWKSAAFHLAREIAAALGTSPLALTVDTPVRGVGLLAITSHTKDAEAGPVPEASGIRELWNTTETDRVAVGVP